MYVCVWIDAVEFHYGFLSGHQEEDAQMCKGNSGCMHI